MEIDIEEEVKKLITKHGQYIVEILEKEYKDLEKNYTWTIPDINDKELSQIINKNNGNSFEKNVLLKDILSKKIGRNYDNKKLEYYKWIVQRWGRIGSKQNFDDLGSFIKDLKANKVSTKTISSYSKIVSFMEPEKYFILDSRVTHSLNWMLFKTREDNQFYFPVLQGRNSDMKYNMDTILSLYYKKRENIYYDKKVAYIIYCELIRKIFEKCNQKIIKKPFYVEMMFFSMFDKTIKEIKKEIEICHKPGSACQRRQNRLRRKK